MVRRRKRGNSFLFYTLFLLNVAASALAIYGVCGQWRIHEESRATYEDLQLSVAVQSEALRSGEQAAGPEGAYASQGMEEEESDQNTTMWMIQQNQAQSFAAADAGSISQAEEEVVSLESTVSSDSPSTSASKPVAFELETTAAPQPTDSGASSKIAPSATVEPWMERAVQVNEAHYRLDFPYLQSVYPQLKGWIFQEGTNVNYPVMQAEDNEYYLERLYNGKKNKDGSIFLDCGNSGDFVDANNYIYGHNTKTGEMFGLLPMYREQAYYDAHPQMTLFTPYGDFCIDIFAVTMSLVEDESSWRVKQFDRRADFDEYTADIKARSFFASEVVPEWGDQLLVLCTCTNDSHGERYVLYGRMRPIVYGTGETIAFTKMDMDGRPTQSGKQVIGSLGKLQVYAQNDELWSQFRYEPRSSSLSRKFGDGGSGATAVAMAVANLVPAEELPRLLGFARFSTGFTFCTHSVNQYFCDNLHAQYQIQTPEEFLRYLPMAIASFTTGNNIWDIKARSADRGGTNMSFLSYVAGIYGLELKTSLVLQDALETLQNGGMVVCLAGGRRSPFAKGSQYVVLAGMDEEYLYILDSYLRSTYSERNTGYLLEIIGPNAVRIKLENIDDIGLHSYYLLQKQPS